MFTTNHSKKFLAAAIVAAGAFTGLLTSTSANAALVSGTATISLNGNWNSSTLASGWSPTTFFDDTFNSTAINGTTAGGTAISGATSSPHLQLAINTNMTTITNAGGTIQATTMDASNSAVGQIGLSGAFRLTTPSASTFLSAEDFQLKQVGGTWNLVGVSGFGPGTFLQLVNVVDNLATTGTLDGDLQFLPDAANGVGFTWATFLSASGPALTTNFGHLSIAPAAVPVPAAVWLFGTGLVSLLAGACRKSGLAI